MTQPASVPGITTRSGDGIGRAYLDGVAEGRVARGYV